MPWIGGDCAWWAYVADYGLAFDPKIVQLLLDTSPRLEQCGGSPTAFETHP